MQAAVRPRGSRRRPSGPSASKACLAPCLPLLPAHMGAHLRRRPRVPQRVQALLQVLVPIPRCQARALQDRDPRCLQQLQAGERRHPAARWLRGCREGAQGSGCWWHFSFRLTLRKKIAGIVRGGGWRRWGGDRVLIVHGSSAAHDRATVCACGLPPTGRERAGSAVARCKSLTAPE